MKVAVIAAIAFAGAVAHADDSRTPRKLWLGAVVGFAMSIDEDQDPGVGAIDIGFAGGLDLGAQQIIGGRALSIDADLLPAGGIYRARGALVIGHAFTTKYSVPCVGPAGYSCTKVYGGRNVRSVFGLKVGAELGTSPNGETTAIEVGVGFRSQISMDATFSYDVLSGAAGGAFDFAWQFGPAYLAMEVRGLASSDAALPMIATLSLGYAPRMWK